MSGLDFAVDASTAVLAWVEAEHPPLHQVDALRAWARRLEVEGPPPVHGYSAAGLQLTLGPSDEIVEFDVIATPLGFGPPYAIIGLKTVHSSAQ